MTHEESEQYAPQRPSHVVAARLKQLREARGWTTKQLAERCGGSLKWNAIRNIEATRSRDRDVSIDEVFLLARVLGVPPLWLLVDPASETTPVAADRVADPWDVAAWVTGRHPTSDPPRHVLGDPAGPQWAEPATVLGLVQQIAVQIEQMRERRELRDKWDRLAGSPSEGMSLDEHDDLSIRSIGMAMHALGKLGYPPPALPTDVLDRADELGIDLPGEED